MVRSRGRAIASIGIAITLAIALALAAGCGAREALHGEGGGGTGGGAGTCACEGDADCPAGAWCDGCACSFACSAEHPCASPLSCCGGACRDLASDVERCGSCENACAADHATMVCVDGQCAIGACDPGFADCDWAPANGCEAEVAACTCPPGGVQGCYSGPPGTLGVGVCAAGTQSCLAGVAWGPCEGQTLPAGETCDGLDDDCDGHGDDWDPDGDGWTKCEGDCCEDTSCAEDPALVNPGAFELPGNGVDDDCDPATLDDQLPAECSGPPLQTPTSAIDLARAMDLCVFTTEESRGWGLISASLSLADGSTAVLPKDLQVGVLADYGPFVLPVAGTTMAALSSGTARDESDPGHVYPQHGFTPEDIGNFNAGTKAPIPADYLAPNGGKVPSTCGVCEGPDCASAFDSVSLRLRIRTPSNAAAFEYWFKFYSAEYPENLCSEYNDFFVALVDGKHPDIPKDRNVAFDEQLHPVSANNTFFTVCGYGDTCPDGTLELTGTGMGGWDGVLLDGAGKKWLQSQVPIVPGETIDLRLVIWDAMDGNVDSLVLLDGFRWLPPSGPIFPLR